MSNEVDQMAYRRLPGTNVSPGLRRTKSVRASFRMLGSRWKPNHNKNEVLIKKDRTNKDLVFERFGKEFNVTRAPGDSFLKGTSKFFHGLTTSTATKENIPMKSEFCGAIPDNVAPKAAALLQIPAANVPTRINKKVVGESLCIDRKMGELITNSEQFNDFRKTESDAACNRSSSCSSSRRSSSSSSGSSSKNSDDTTANISGSSRIVERNRTATIRRAPYWTNNLLYSKDIK